MLQSYMAYDKLSPQIDFNTMRSEQETLGISKQTIDLVELIETDAKVNRSFQVLLPELRLPALRELDGLVRELEEVMEIMWEYVYLTQGQFQSKYPDWNYIAVRSKVGGKLELLRDMFDYAVIQLINNLGPDLDGFSNRAVNLLKFFFSEEVVKLAGAVGGTMVMMSETFMLNKNEADILSAIQNWRSSPEYEAKVYDTEELLESIVGDLKRRLEARRQRLVNKFAAVKLALGENLDLQAFREECEYFKGLVGGDDPRRQGFGEFMDVVALYEERIFNNTSRIRGLPASLDYTQYGELVLSVVKEMSRSDCSRFKELLDQVTILKIDPRSSGPETTIGVVFFLVNQLVEQGWREQ